MAKRYNWCDDGDQSKGSLHDPKPCIHFIGRKQTVDQCHTTGSDGEGIQSSALLGVHSSIMPDR